MRKDSTGGTSRGGKPPPHCKSLLLCRETSEDATTGELTLRHLVETLYCTEFPGWTPPFSVFAQLYDGIGGYEWEIRVQDLVDGAIIARGTHGHLEFPERLAKMYLIVPIRSMRLPHPGRYELVVFANGDELARQYFDAEAYDGQER